MRLQEWMADLIHDEFNIISLLHICELLTQGLKAADACHITGFEYFFTANFPSVCTSHVA